MTKSLKILCRFIFAACPFLISAQELISGAEKGFERDSERTEISAYFTSSFIPSESDVSDPATLSPGGNNVFIAQAGENNSISADLYSQDAIVDMTQVGERNDVQMKIKANVVRGVIVQQGNDNQVLDYVSLSDQPVYFDFKQQGNNNYIENFGSNSISNGLKVELTGNSKAVIIRNFN